MKMDSLLCFLSIRRTKKGLCQKRQVASVQKINFAFKAMSTMRATYVTLIFLLLTTVGRAHDYFFAFAEVEYNAEKGVFEITLESTAHDVVRALQSEDISITDLSKHYTDSTMNRAIETSVNKHLALSSGLQTTTLHLDGYEVMRNGLVLFYLSSDKIHPEKGITFRFDWLMQTFSEQQNKITLNINNQKYTAVFMNRQPVVTINFREE